MAVDAECRQTFLRMACKHGCEVDCARTFRAVEAPHGFRPMGMHIHCFRAVTPAGCYRDCGSHPFAFELPGTGGSFGNASYSAVGNHTFNRCAVGISQVRANQFGNGLGQVHGLILKTFTHAPLASVNGRSDTYFGIIIH